MTSPAPSPFRRILKTRRETARVTGDCSQSPAHGPCASRILDCVADLRHASRLDAVMVTGRVLTRIVYLAVRRILASFAASFDAVFQVIGAMRLAV